MFQEDTRRDSNKNQPPSLKQLNCVLIIITQEKSKESGDSPQKSNCIIKELGNILFENRLSLFELNGCLHLLPI